MVDDVEASQSSQGCVLLYGPAIATDALFVNVVLISSSVKKEDTGVSLHEEDSSKLFS